MGEVERITADRWGLIGEKSTHSLIVRGGNEPVYIEVSARDSRWLLELLDDANRGRSRDA